MTHISLIIHDLSKLVTYTRNSRFSTKISIETKHGMSGKQSMNWKANSIIQKRLVLGDVFGAKPYEEYFIDPVTCECGGHLAKEN